MARAIDLALARRQRQAQAEAQQQAQDEFLAQAKGEKGERGEKGQPGEKGERGEKGPKGDKPAHQWKGTELRFEKPDGTWGRFVDLQGPKGARGPRGGGGGGTGTVFDPTTLPVLDSPAELTDYLIIERDGVAYRVSIEALQSILGGGGTEPGLNDVTVNGVAVTVNGNTVQATP